MITTLFFALCLILAMFPNQNEAKIKYEHQYLQQSHFIPLINRKSNSYVNSQYKETLQSDVPLRNNSASLELLSSIIPNQEQKQQQSSQQNSASSSYTQQNVIQLVQNINERLNQIQRIEMRFPIIQEIFNSIDMTSGTVTFSMETNPFNTKSNQSFTEDKNKLYNILLSKSKNDLIVFGQRLTQKLQKALNIIKDLQKFFNGNISNILHIDEQHYAIKKEYENIFWSNIMLNEFDISSSSHPKYPICLESYVDSCYDGIMPIPQIERLVFDNKTKENFNNQQIHIVNYGKINQERYHQNMEHNNFIDRFSKAFLINSYIKNMINMLKVQPQPLHQHADEKNDKTVLHKCLSSHIKHIYFLSANSSFCENDKHMDVNKYKYNISQRLYQDGHFSYLYASAIEQKYLVILLDIGRNMNLDLWILAKTYIINILEMMSSNDLISVFIVADTIETMGLTEPYLFETFHGITVTNRERKNDILNYLNHIVLRKSSTNHSLAFEYAFKMLSDLEKKDFISTKDPLEFLYVTTDSSAKLFDVKKILNIITNGQKTLQKSVRINICTILTDEVFTSDAQDIFEDIAIQNYSKYDIEISQSNRILSGKVFNIKKSQKEKIRQISKILFDNYFQESVLRKSFKVHSPVIQTDSHNNKELIVSITQVVFGYGVVGVDLYLTDLIEDVINYGIEHLPQQEQNIENFNTEYSYGFIMDLIGNTLSHPAFSSPYNQQQTPFAVDIAYLENSTHFSTIRKRMLSEEAGNATDTIYIKIERIQIKLQRFYQWKNILNIYILCIAITKRESTEVIQNPIMLSSSSKPLQHILPTALPMIFGLSTSSKIPMNKFQFENSYMSDISLTLEYEYDFNEGNNRAAGNDLLYHRLDLLRPLDGPINMCRYFRQLTTMDAATLYLSPSAFESPFTFLHNSRQSSLADQFRTTESIMAYLRDTTGLLANPGLRPQIRNEVNILYQSMQHLKKRHQDIRGSMRNHIIRRYIASMNGVLQIYPGCQLNNDYEPSNRPWFLKAIQHIDKTISTEPYLDAAGAGYIVTIAYTIFYRQSNELKSNQPVAVVAIDLPYAYFYRMILETTSSCQSYGIKCLLFENEGYLIAHPSMLEASTATLNYRRPKEHLTHKESYLANDILNHKILVHKLACAKYQNRILHRYYSFNTSLDEILTNVVHNERTKYAIALLKGSNIFAAVLNSTCEGEAFCPCSTIDRECLNCNRMDQMDCECPCECPIPLTISRQYYPLFKDHLINDKQESSEWKPLLSMLNITHQYGYCKSASEYFTIIPTITTYKMTTQSGVPTVISGCTTPHCDVFSTLKECIATIGCEWCQQDSDGDNFPEPFCSIQSECFNGVLEGLSPYGFLDSVDLLATHVYNPGVESNSYSTFGSIGAACLILSIIIGLVIYCYRYNTDTCSQERFYIDTLQEENYGLPLSRFNYDDCQSPDEKSGGSGANTPNCGLGSCDGNASGNRNFLNAADISPYHMSTGSNYRRPPNGESDHGYSTMTPHEDSSEHQLAEPLLINEKEQSKSDTMSISTSISSPSNRQHYQQSLPHHINYSYIFSPKNNTQYVFNTNTYSSPMGANINQIHETSQHYNEHKNMKDISNVTNLILAPVTVHRHMEPTES